MVVWLFNRPVKKTCLQKLNLMWSMAVTFHWQQLHYLYCQGWLVNVTWVTHKADYCCNMCLSEWVVLSHLYTSFIGICFEYQLGKYIICIVILSTAEHQLLCSNGIIHNTASNPVTKIHCVRGAQIFKENLVATLNFCRSWKDDMKWIPH